jgi:hypothetical protein
LRAGERKRGRLEVGGDPDRRAPADSECEREEGSAGAGGPRGPKAGRPAGFGWAGGGKKRKGKKKRGRWAGPRVERWVEFVFFLFKSFSNLFQTLFKFKSFTSFQIQILKKMYPTI